MTPAASLTASPPVPRGRRSAGDRLAVVGAAVFLLGTLLHPARDGHGIAAAGHRYGVTHAIQAIGLLLLAVALADLSARARARQGHRRSTAPWLTAMAGTVAWVMLIVYDGAHNPLAARLAPQLVHTSADIDAGGALIVVPALVLFPLGYLLLGSRLFRDGRRWTGALLGLGALVYTLGGVFIFVLGPHSPVIEAVEIAGATPYALAFVLLGAGAEPGVRSAGPDGRGTEEAR